MTITLKPKGEQDKERIKEFYNKIDLLLREYSDVSIFIMNNVEWHDNGIRVKPYIDAELMHGVVRNCDFVIPQQHKGAKI